MKRITPFLLACALAWGPGCKESEEDQVAARERILDDDETVLSQPQLERIKKKAKQKALTASQKQLGVQLSIKNGPPQQHGAPWPPG